MIVFYAGYLALALMTIAAMVAVWSKWWLALISAVEFTLFLVRSLMRKQMYAINAPADGGEAFSAFMLLAFYLLMCFAPWTHLRQSYALDGFGFCFTISYKIVSYVVLFWFATEAFKKQDDFNMYFGVTIIPQTVLALGVLTSLL